MNASKSCVGIRPAARSQALRTFVSACLLLVAPAAADAATVSVEPYRAGPRELCARYARCPEDMLRFTAAAGEVNQVTITRESAAPAPGHFRFVVRDEGAPVQPGPGCERVDDRTAACIAAVIRPVSLGDGDDRIESPAANVSGGDGADVLRTPFGRGDAGDDILRCFPSDVGCGLSGGPGDDLLTGGTLLDGLSGGRGNDVMHGRAGSDTLEGGSGDDRLVGGAGRDRLRGDSGADRLVSRERRAAGQARVLDRVDCGSGSPDLAVADRRDHVKRCERVRLGPDLTRVRPPQPCPAAEAWARITQSFREPLAGARGVAAADLLCAARSS